MSDQKTSLLVNRQVPEFVREEHPNFVSFLEAYYEFLENAQGTKKNDLVSKSKSLRFVSDVDVSITDFEDNFLNTYAALVPKDVQADKAFMIKNILPFYLAKGSEKSFKLLFRLLFNEEVDIYLPKNNVLRTSASKWLIENALRVNSAISSNYVGDGTETTFYLTSLVSNEEIDVYVNGSLVTTGFNVRKEYRKLVFDTAPADGSIINVFYDTFDISLLTNRQLTGSTSGATALVERVARRIVTNQSTVELYVDAKTLIGNFINGEEVTTDIIDSNDTVIELTLTTFSALSRINVITGGASYNVGDVVTITGGGFDTPATAVIDDVFEGFIDKITVNFGASGFKDGGSVIPSGNASSFLTLAIDAVDTSGANTANTFFIVGGDEISPYSSVLISATDYGFPSTVIPAGENVSTVLADAWSQGVITDIGAITNVAILFSNTATTITPDLNALGATYNSGTVEHLITSFGSLGRIKINDAGSGYQIGDEIVFGGNPPMTYGDGAAAAVTNVSSSGAITKIEFQPSRISGTANTINNSILVIGTGTLFDSELRVGDRIMVNNMSRFVNAISNSTHLTVNASFSASSTDKKVGVYGRYIIGGQNYVQNSFPTITVSSTTGSSANLELSSIYGDGEQLSASGAKQPGEIVSIKVLTGGTGYEFLPLIDLTTRGDGNATANTEIEKSYVTFPGRWTTSDSILSSTERKIAGRNYYIDYSYVTSSAVEFSKYKKILKELLHPSGFINYSEYTLSNSFSSNSNIVSSSTRGLGGTVSISSGSIVVTGTNTRFNIANTSGVLTVGTRIAVNNEIRTVNSIVNNTTITVTSSFSANASAQSIILLT